MSTPTRQLAARTASFDTPIRRARARPSPPPSSSAPPSSARAPCAVGGTQRVLEVEPDSLHARVPFFVGSAEDVADLEKRLG